VSRSDDGFSTDDLPDPQCVYCGESFDPEESPQCPARDEGVCRP